MVDGGRVTLTTDGGVGRVVFDRPTAHNAMTWGMYGDLEEACERLASDPTVRVVTLRGAGGRAFVAGTDIGEFASFAGGGDGVAYEARIDRCVGLVEALPQPTVAVVDGWAMGGGLAIAAACDFRVASEQARFGVPIARTVGNCLSAANLARLVEAFGVQRVRRMLLLAEEVSAREALACGFVHEVTDQEGVGAAADRLLTRLAALAPLTQWATKESLRRGVAASVPDDEDIIRRVYGSADFREGVAAFAEKRQPGWTGR
jgi:enoyl-CoA hydratase